MATIAQVETRGQSFWQKYTLGLAVFIVFGFAQFGARGMVDYRAVPVSVHVHAVVMLSWLALVVTQATLVQRDNLALHRKLGWAGVVLAAGVVGMCSYVGVIINQIGMQPFFFTRPYFMALTQVNAIVFGGVVVAAILRRRDTEWHRRLLVGTLVLFMEPALGRLLPMPLIMPWGEWLALAIQLAALGILVRHDRKTRGAIHPATIAVGLVVTLAHCVVEGLAISPFFIDWTNKVIGA